jgi:2-polyprenyl-6-hydroxyphenyl methylase/3-demethylubiquinone-9 3-methyltransferase
MAPHLAGKGYRHVGVDLRVANLEQAAGRGLLPVAADVGRLPVRDASVDVVAAGEILEHVEDLAAVVAELCRVLRPGGLLVLDTVNATALARVATVTVGERLPRIPAGIHDPRLFVDPARLTRLCAAHGVRLQVRGIRPTVAGLLRWLVLPSGPTTGASAGRPLGRMVPTRSTAVLYQGVGRRQGAVRAVDTTAPAVGQEK